MKSLYVGMWSRTENGMTVIWQCGAGNWSDYGCGKMVLIEEQELTLYKCPPLEGLPDSYLLRYCCPGCSKINVVERTQEGMPFMQEIVSKRTKT